MRADYDLPQIAKISVWGDSGTGKVINLPQKQSMPKIQLQDIPNGTIATFEYNGKTYTGTINDGQMAIKRKGVFKSLSAASGKITGASRNGWKDWSLLLPNRITDVLAEDWREKQLAKQLKKQQK
ncbi:MAG: DUF2924 domain-containing protein [Armatimonadetes bacterium]|nr:DUF2924 domain-containing protein [Armatimonadota bacterium]